MTKVDMKLLYASILAMMLKDEVLSLTGKQKSQIQSLIIKCIR